MTAILVAFGLLSLVGVACLWIAGREADREQREYERWLQQFSEGHW